MKAKTIILPVVKVCGVIILSLPFSAAVSAEDYFWCASSFPEFYCTGNYWTLSRYPSPQAFTDALKQNFDPSYPPASFKTGTQTIVVSETKATSIYTFQGPFSDMPKVDVAWGLTRGGDSCSAGTIYNPGSGACESADVGQPRKEQGLPDDGLSCSPSKAKGDPVNIATGNSFQEEADIPLSAPNLGSFSRFYNSDTGYWTHSDSDHLIIAKEAISLFLSSGQQLLFTRADSVAIPEASTLGSLVKVAQGWTYNSSQNSSITFDESGALISKTAADGTLTTYTTNGNTTVAQNDKGFTYSFTQDVHFQPTSLSYSGQSVSYTYGQFNQLTDVSSTRSGITTTRHYGYASASSLKLTSITDERGVVFASWIYDDSGRVVTSSHANGADLMSFTYNSDGSTIVTNELGRQTTYRYQLVQGIKRIVAIEGEPSANCPASNSTYTYNDRGQVLTKTDARGLITTYSYNDRGLEVSRTEASGTPLARTITTEWDPTRFLKTQVVEPTRTTLYTYDVQGRPLSQQTTPN